MTFLERSTTFRKTAMNVMHPIKRYLRCATATLCALGIAATAPTWAAFTINGNGTVTDDETGLIWDRAAGPQRYRLCDR